MKPFRHGLVVGKFCPPHTGHHHLVATAAGACDRVTVVVGGTPADPIAVMERTRWLADALADRPTVRVVADLDDTYDLPPGSDWAEHARMFAAATARAVIADGLSAEAAVVDAVFSSEPYGQVIAGRLGATHVMVDQDRVRHPVSGTAVRADIPGHWADLAAPARAGLALRVVVLGAESTGTTTLARDLAARLAERGGPWAGTAWVPEYGREYSAAKVQAARYQAKAVGAPDPGIEDVTWTPGDFVHIATTQRDLEDAAAGAGGPVLVCDTDAFATGVWLRRYLGQAPAVAPWAAQVAAVADSRRHDLYLLTDHAGVAFEQDGTRDGEHIRTEMTGWFVAALEASGRPYVWMRGERAARTAAAAAAVDTLIRSAWSFTTPQEGKENHR